MLMIDAMVVEWSLKWAMMVSLEETVVLLLLSWWLLLTVTAAVVAEVL